MNIKGLFLSMLVALSAMQMTSAPAEAGHRGAAIAAGAIFLGLAIAGAAAHDHGHRHHHHRRHRGDCDRHGCYYYDRYGNEHYRGDRIYREYDRHWHRHH